jgi:type II secretory pathway component GspD/PulD (secretin)
MSRRSPAAILLALLFAGVPPPQAALACPNLAQAPDAPSVPASQAVPTPSPTAAPADPAAISLDFDHADLEAVIQWVSELVGFNYVLAPDVRGKVTVRTPRPIRPEDLFSVFLSILEVQGFTAVKAGDLYKIVRTERARERAIPTVIGPRPGPPSSPDAGPPTRPGAAPPPPPPGSPTTPPGGPDPQPGIAGAQPIEVQVVPLHFADAQDLAGILNQLYAGAGLARPVIVADRRTNSLVIRARRSDLEDIGRLLGRED